MTDYTKKFGHSKEYMRKMTPNDSAMCMCPACGLFFKSSAGFDMHRIDDPDGKYGRRCLNIEEMKAKKMDRNKTGHWLTRKMDSKRVPFAIGETSPEGGVIT